jgi:hypothetical protein
MAEGDRVVATVRWHQRWQLLWLATLLAIVAAHLTREVCCLLAGG